MGLNFQNLDGVTRPLMVEEIDMDVASPQGLYLSNYLTDAGQNDWPTLLRDAASAGTDDSLANTLNARRSFKSQVEKKKPKGGFTMAAVPYTAAQTLAESQFNMYYMRALARRAIAEGRHLEVYRAKAVENPRSQSEAMIGTNLNAELVLTALRQTRGVEPPIGVPLPNTGITVRLV